MKRLAIDPEEGFHVLAGTERSQAATMVIEPGDKEGGPDNRHPGDQWLYVISGRGHAHVEGHTHELSAGVLLLIAAGERHEIRAEGTTPLRTFNIYSPPQYDEDGEEL